MPSSGHSNKPNNVKYGVSMSEGGLQPHNQQKINKFQYINNTICVCHISFVFHR